MGVTPPRHQWDTSWIKPASCQWATQGCLRTGDKPSVGASPAQAGTYQGLQAHRAEHGKARQATGFLGGAAKGKSVPGCPEPGADKSRPQHGPGVAGDRLSSSPAQWQAADPRLGWNRLLGSQHRWGSRESQSGSLRPITAFRVPPNSLLLLLVTVVDNWTPAHICAMVCAAVRQLLSLLGLPPSEGRGAASRGPILHSDTALAFLSAEKCHLSPTFQPLEEKETWTVKETLTVHWTYFTGHLGGVTLPVHSMWDQQPAAILSSSDSSTTNHKVWVFFFLLLFLFFFFLLLLDTTF